MKIDSKQWKHSGKNAQCKQCKQIWASFLQLSDFVSDSRHFGNYIYTQSNVVRNRNWMNHWTTATVVSVSECLSLSDWLSFNLARFCWTYPSVWAFRQSFVLCCFCKRQKQKKRNLSSSARLLGASPRSHVMCLISLHFPSPFFALFRGCHSVFAGTSAFS